MSKQNKYTKSAKWHECTVRISGVCNGDPEKVVLAHLNGAGGGMRHSDIHGAYACSDCHTWLDGGYTTDKRHVTGRDERDLWHLQAVIRTQRIMIRDGVLKL